MRGKYEILNFNYNSEGHLFITFLEIKITIKKPAEKFQQTYNIFKN